MISAGRGITAGIIRVAFVVAVLIGLFPLWVTFPTTVAADGMYRVGGSSSAIFSLPRPAGIPIGTGLSLTPPMGWNGFNHFHLAVTEATVEAEARALVSSGMRSAGYTYVNLDGGWNLRLRNLSGGLQPDPAKFPHGIRPVADYVHSLGLRFGIYASAGILNCAGTSAGSYGHYRSDAAAFASWGVDYLKLDWCYIPYRDFPHLNRRQLSQLLATQMADAIAASGRTIVYDVNAWEKDEPWTWARGLASLWRTAPDIQDRYRSLILNFTLNVKRYESAGPGGWNDPDMLEVGNGGMSTTEYQSQFSLWAEMAAPLIAGNDLTKMSPAARSILTNVGVIAIDQDRLGRQGYPVASAGGHWVLTKPLANGDRAVLLFNQTDTTATISTTAAQVGMASEPGYTLLNLWSDTVSETTDVIDATVPAHGVVFYELSTSAIRPVKT